MSRRAPGLRVNKTGFRGVSTCKGTYSAKIKLSDGRYHPIGTYATADEAATAYDIFARMEYGGKALLNFPRPGEMSARPGVQSQEWELPSVEVHPIGWRKPPPASGHSGVCWHAKHGCWLAQVKVDGKRRTVGNYATIEEAAAMVRRCEEDQEFARAWVAKDKRDKAGLSIQRSNKTGFRGVKRERHGRFIARVHHRDGDIYLGTYATPEEAAVAYDRKVRELYGADAPLNFPFPGERPGRRGVEPKAWGDLPVPVPILVSDRPPELRAKIAAGMVRYNQANGKPQRVPKKDPEYFKYKDALPALRADDRATYIYALHDPSETSQRVYVGMSVNPQERYDAHMEGVDVGRRTIAKGWIKSIFRRGGRPAMEILEIVPPGSDYQEAERFWIESMRFMGVKLANMTDGGHGARGYYPPPEVRAKLSAVRMGRKMPRDGVERGATKRRGQKRTPEARARIAEANRGRRWTDTQRANTEAARAGQPTRSGTGFKGIKAIPGGRYVARISDRHLGCFDTPEAAARAYDAAARAAWGADAALNFPCPGERSARKAG